MQSKFVMVGDIRIHSASFIGNSIGGGHCAQIEYAEEFNRIATDFLLGSD